MEHSSGELLLMNLFRELYHPPVQHQQWPITCFSNFLLDQTIPPPLPPSTLCQTESLESKQGAPKQFFF